MHIIPFSSKIVFLGKLLLHGDLESRKEGNQHRGKRSSNKRAARICS